jgi:hypothetical protein
MIEFGTITLYREKSTVHRFTQGAGTGGDEAAMVISSNRVTMPIKTQIDNYIAVVRGVSVPAALRMTALAIDEFRRDENLLFDPQALDWDSMWRRKLSAYDNDYNREQWVALHLNGKMIYTNKEGVDPSDEIERLTAGKEVTEAIVLEATKKSLGPSDDLVVEHDSQTAFVFTLFPTYLRASAINRSDRRTGSYALSAYHPAPTKQIRLSHFVGFCADLNEALTLKGFMERVQELTAANKIAQSGITPTKVAATRNRRRDLQEAIDNFEKTNKIVYRPERPNLF